MTRRTWFLASMLLSAVGFWLAWPVLAAREEFGDNLTIYEFFIVVMVVAGFVFGLMFPVPPDLAAERSDFRLRVGCGCVVLIGLGIGTIILGAMLKEGGPPGARGAFLSIPLLTAASASLAQAPPRRK